uniref:Triosephosphate isomerase cytosolic-like n=2 Tax=Rhizophora mucronata TaxID=61149 RepID=A0A2P2L2D5_RHIMU
MARKFFVGGNWKCNGTTEEVKKIVTILNEAEVPPEDVVEVVVSPPYVFLPMVKSLLRSDFHVAAQNSWVRKGGAFTGEVRYVLTQFLHISSGACLCFDVKYAGLSDLFPSVRLQMLSET